MAVSLQHYSVYSALAIVFYSTMVCCSMSLHPTTPQPYVVYMGNSPNADHFKLLSSIIPSEESERRFLLNSYDHAFTGFSAMLTQAEASALSNQDDVVSVFPDPVLKLQTTQSWDFLEAADSKPQSMYPRMQKSSDVIIGIIDTGIWPESPSFNDHGIGNIPSKWKGVCMEAPDFTKSNCNRKLIGARFYSHRPVATKPNQISAVPSQEQDTASPRDSVGHGTHTASTAGGAPVHNASYYGLASGMARGGFPSARIASYKACTLGDCPGSIILKAIDDAIRDGVDIISISISMGSILQSDFLSDPIAIGAFHAEQNGVHVVCAGGNEGPYPYTVVNTAPWVFTVAASTIDRSFQTTILLGNNQSYKGTAINLSPLSIGKQYALRFGEQVAAKSTPASDAGNCIPGSLDSKKVAGKIIICVNERAMISRKIKKLVVEDAKAAGVIIIDGRWETNSPFDSGTYPFAEVGETAGYEILRYVNSTRNPSATILPTTTENRAKPAPVVADFSSRGPGSLTGNILKPDIMAPGVAILAATVPQREAYYGAPGNTSSAFVIRSGTSMACPHVTGAMAFIKSVHPEWSFSMIKSALMTTASVSDNSGKPLTNITHSVADPHQVGAGEMRPIMALDPGLAFETTPMDHLSFLCFYGYSQKRLRSVFHSNFTCPKNSSSAKHLISNINYPSISIDSLDPHDSPRKVKRVVTHLGSSSNPAPYFHSVNAPPGLAVKVVPKKIVFREGMEKASFKVFFDGKGAGKGYNFGDIRWFDGSHVVRIVFAVNVV